MDIYLGLLLAYAGFTTGSIWQMWRLHKKWEQETLPLIRENQKLKCLMSLNGMQVK